MNIGDIKKSQAKKILSVSKVSRKQRRSTKEQLDEGRKQIARTADHAALKKMTQPISQSGIDPASIESVTIGDEV